MPDNLLTRREFTVESVLAILATATITISCGSDSPSTNPSPSPSGDVSGAISANHGHIATVTRAMITSPTTVALDIRGQADHPHIVDLSAAEITMIGSGGRVSKQSSIDVSHSHTVTFN